jgi:tRNA A37 threonylcarbamoyladenosine biosynthesis protein TsaE
MNEYDLSNGKPVYHFDLYRVQNLSEIEELGFESYVEKKKSKYYRMVGKG